MNGLRTVVDQKAGVVCDGAVGQRGGISGRIRQSAAVQAQAVGPNADTVEVRLSAQDGVVEHQGRGAAA